MGVQWWSNHWGVPTVEEILHQLNVSFSHYLVGGISTPLNNISQLGWLYIPNRKIENVPNHQSAIYRDSTIQGGAGFLPSRVSILWGSRPQPLTAPRSHGSRTVRVIDEQLLTFLDGFNQNILDDDLKFKRNLYDFMGISWWCFHGISRNIVEISGEYTGI